MFNKENVLVAIMFITFMSVIGFAVTLFAGAFFVQALGVAGAIALPAGFALVALAGNFVVNKLEA